MKTDVWPRAVAFATLVLLPATAFAQAPMGVIGIAREVASDESRLQGAHDVVFQGYVFREGTLSGRRVVVGRSGAGRVNATIVTAQRVRSNRRFALATS